MPISLLSHLYKLLTSIVTKRFQNKFDFYQPVEWAEFKGGFGTVAHLQTMRFLIEKTTEYSAPLNLALSIIIRFLSNVYNRRSLRNGTNWLGTMHVKFNDHLQTHMQSTLEWRSAAEDHLFEVFLPSFGECVQNMHWENKGIKI